MMKNILALLILLTGVAHAQFAPPSVGIYTFDGSAWTPAITTAVGGSISFPQSTGAMYCFNTTTGRWVPADSSCLGGGAGVASINSTTGAFTFTGAGVSCTGSTCTFTGGGGVSGTAGLPAFLNSTTTATSFDPTGGGTYVAPLTSVTVPTPIATAMPITGNTAQISSGDSITFGNGSTSCATGGDCYVQRIAQANGTSGSVTNLGVASDMACDMVKHIFNSDTPVSGDAKIRTMMIGLNDADNKGAGGYEATYSSCLNAAIAYQSLPSSQVVRGSAVTPAANWATDTTYSQMTGLTSTTNAAAQVWPFTTTVAAAQEVFLWYRCWDQGGATTPGTFTAKIDSGTAININSWPSVPMATANGATDSICFADLGATNSSAGAHSVTVTTTNANTNTTLGIGFGPDAVTMPVWVGGVTRNTQDCLGADTARYDQLVRNNVVKFQTMQAGFPNLVFIATRNYMTSAPSAMLSGTCQHHPNPTGHQQLANAFLGVSANPLIVQTSDPTVTALRIIQSTANCNISITDRVVAFLVASPMTCTLPTALNQPLPKSIVLMNASSGLVTLANGVGGSGSAAGVVLAVHQGVTITSSFVGVWDVVGTSIPADVSLYAAKIAPATPYTLLSTDQFVFIGTASAVTCPASVTIGKAFEIYNGSTGDITFAGCGTANTTILHPGNGAILRAATSANYKVDALTVTGGYKTVTTLASTTPTLLVTDEFIEDPNSGATTMTLPTTFVDGKVIPINNRGTTTLAFTGAASGNANTSTLLQGQFGWLVGGPSGRWDFYPNQALSIPNGTATYTGGTGITSVACASGFLCSNTRGTLTIVGGTATTGTIATVTFSAALSTAPWCTTTMNSGTSFFGIGTSAPTTTAFNVTAAVSVIGTTFNVDYQCRP